MTELVERVARAIGRHVHIISGSCDLEAATRAAIAAMRGPTGAMVEAGSGVTWWDGRDDEEWEENVSTDTAKSIYQAMIDEALK